jgi:hypothetical protein
MSLINHKERKPQRHKDTKKNKKFFVSLCLCVFVVLFYTILNCKYF